MNWGAGDGRVVIAAAGRYGVRAVGIERNRILAWFSRWAVKRSKLEDKVRILTADFLEQDLSEATVITAYLSQKANDRLEPKLRRELREGTKIVSADHTFNFPEKAKDKTGHFWTRLYIR